MKEQFETVRQWSCIVNQREFLYRAIHTRKFSEELGWFVTFGVEIVNCSDNVRSCLDDISPNCDEVVRFAKLCMDLELEPEHLPDAAENFLAELYGPGSEASLMQPV